MARFGKIIAGIVVASMLCISVVMLIGMVHEVGCVARAVNGGTCPANAFALINFHMSAFTRLAQVLISAFFGFLLVLFVYAIPKVLVHSSKFSVVHVPVSYTSHRRVSRWLALQESSPSRRS